MHSKHRKTKTYSTIASSTICFSSFNIHFPYIITSQSIKPAPSMEDPYNLFAYISINLPHYNNFLEFCKALHTYAALLKHRFNVLRVNRNTIYNLKTQTAERYLKDNCVSCRRVTSGEFAARLLLLPVSLDEIYKPVGR